MTARSPGRIFLPRMVQGSPLTATRPSWMISLASRVDLDGFGLHSINSLFVFLRGISPPAGGEFLSQR